MNSKSQALNIFRGGSIGQTTPNMIARKPMAPTPTPIATMPARSSRPAPITRQVDQQRQAMAKTMQKQQTFGVPGAK